MRQDSDKTVPPFLPNPSRHRSGSVWTTGGQTLFSHIWSYFLLQSSCNHSPDKSFFQLTSGSNLAALASSPIMRSSTCTVLSPSLLLCCLHLQSRSLCCNHSICTHHRTTKKVRELHRPTQEITRVRSMRHLAKKRWMTMDD